MIYIEEIIIHFKERYSTDIIQLFFMFPQTAYISQTE